MKLNEITETGFYTGELDNKREIIYEVINNTDEEWLKETPEQKLLIDEWTYEYTDEDNRKHYEIYGGNLVAVVNAEPIDVIKITDTKYTMDVSDPTIASKCNGTAMMEAKPTRLEIAQQQLDQLKAENEELEAENKTYKSSIVANLDKNISKRYRELLEENDQLKETNEGLLSIQYKLADSNLKLRQTLAEIKEIAEELKNFYEELGKCEDLTVVRLKQILQKIKECEINNEC